MNSDTAIQGDTADLSPAQWESRRWAAVGMSPPAYLPPRGRPRKVSTPVSINATGKPHFGGHPPRPRRMRADGVILWQCNDCRKWLAASGFYVRRAAPEGLQPKCKRCAKWVMAERTARLRDERNGEKAVQA